MRTTASRAASALMVCCLVLLAAASPAAACAGLFAPGADIKLLRTATLAAYHDGIEHYITSFTFSGGGAEVGSIIPLPDIPTSVERGGDWTLQRLERETQPQPEAFSAARASSAASDQAEVILETRIDALDLTVLKGGAQAVGKWAREHGFSLTPDAPEVLEHYAQRSPIFMAARFDAKAAEERGQDVGEGTPVHLTIPTDRPWVPLRILGLGKVSGEIVEADVYLLTDERPKLVTTPVAAKGGIFRQHDAAATDQLLTDLRSDKGMDWIPERMWLTYLRVASDAEALGYDLTVPPAAAAEPVPTTFELGEASAPKLVPAGPDILVSDPPPLVLHEFDPPADSRVPVAATGAAVLLSGAALAAFALRRRLFG